MSATRNDTLESFTHAGNPVKKIRLKGRIYLITGNIKREWRYLFPVKPQVITTCSYPTNQDFCYSDVFKHEGTDIPNITRKRPKPDKNRHENRKRYVEVIVISKINTDHFKIKTNLIQLVQANPYHGFERENPHTHINNIKRITSTLKFRDVPNDVIKLIMFPYSLEGNARVWYEKEPPNLILTWEDLVNKFVNQFFSPSKTTHLKNEISRFTQRFKETFGEAWERFKEMLRACPHHEFTELAQIDTFYNGLNDNDRDSLNDAAGGNLLSKTTREALQIIENKSKSSVAYEGPLIPTPRKVAEQETKETTDKEKSNFQRSTAHIQPSVTPILKHDVPKTLPKPNIPYPSRLNDQKLRKKATNQMEKFFQIFQDLHFDISFADALLLMPKFSSMIKSLLTNKDKLFELAKIPLNENCSAMLLKKLPEKLRDPGKFLIPSDFTGMDVCHALADLDRSMTRLKGDSEDVFVKVGKFYFPTDFVVVDFEADPRVPLILGRSFLRTDHALIDIYREEITLRLNDEAITFNLNQTTRYSFTYYDLSVNQLDIIDVAREEYAQEILSFSSNSSGGNPTMTFEAILSDSSHSLTSFEGSDFILEEIDAYLKEESISPCVHGQEAFDILKACHEGPTEGHHGIDFMGPFSSLRGNRYILVAVEYLSKWVEAKVLPTNDARVVVMFLKSLFARFRTPKAIVSDRGTNFFNDKFAKLMFKYGVTHRLSTAYHPQTSGQVEVLNRGLKRIIERMVGEKHAIWSEKLDDTLWAFRTTYKTPIGCTPYKLVYGESCHLPIELEHKAYWALKHVNFDLKTAVIIESFNLMSLVSFVIKHTRIP
uniref:Reverse transcriptase domain-containing protein n=1 Tax=Tanacetum cinerariifolium TaxID=118510 RepID=A0A6L2MCS2_TANCI|nr:reverse transcriptase domain-containing protein [Tanacetum cinerariifolium]